MKKAFVLCMLCVLSAGILACKTSSSTLVVISPGDVTLTPGQVQQFTANVPVTWSATGDGTVNSAGFFTAGSATGQTARVTATASDGSGSSAYITVSVVTATSNSTTTGANSNLKHRVFASNTYTGTTGTGYLNIINADNDKLSAAVITIGGTPSFMAQSADRAVEVVFDSSGQTLKYVLSGTEVLGSTVSLPGATSSVQVSSNDFMAYAAVPTAQVSGSSDAGAVYTINFSAATIAPTGVANAFAVAGVNANILAFARNSDIVTHLSIQSDGTFKSTTLDPSHGFPTGTFSRPVGAFSNSDGTQIYVLNSGTINGGTASPSVTQLTNVSTAAAPNPPTLGVSRLVRAAEIGGILNGVLWVAGEDSNNAGNGVLTALDPSTLAIKAGPIPLGPGIPTVLADDGTNLWIGSSGKSGRGDCSVSTLSAAGGNGCLYVYNTSTGAVARNTLPTSFVGQSTYMDDILSMVWLQSLNNRKVMYVAEGGTVNGKVFAYTYNGTSLTQLSAPYLDTVGAIVDLKLAP